MGERQLRKSALTQWPQKSNLKLKMQKYYKIKPFVNKPGEIFHNNIHFLERQEG